jgi:translation initiation factor IF-2
LESQKQAQLDAQEALNSLSTSSQSAADKLKVLRGQETEASQQRRKEIESQTKTQTKAIQQQQVERANSTKVAKELSAELARSEAADRRSAARTGQEIASSETKELRERLKTQEGLVAQNNANIVALTSKRNEAIKNINAVFDEVELLEAQEKAKEEAERAAEAAKAAREKAIEQGKKAAQDRLKIVEEGIKLELLTEDEAVQEKIKLAENLADQAKLDAQQNIDNATLRAATIKRIDAELAKERQQILVDEQKRILTNEIQRLETLQAASRGLS